MYDQALEINPNDAEIYANKGERFIYKIEGVALEKLEEFNEAIMIYDRAL